MWVNTLNLPLALALPPPPMFIWRRGILDYFINNRYIKDCVVNIPKDVYFGV
jgi:hypothetical protein